MGWHDRDYAGAGGPAVVVKKSGFFTAIAKGVFGTLIVGIICGTALGLYGMRMADGHVGALLHNTGQVVEQVLKSLPEWQKAMPPAVQDALNDRRAPEYRDNVKVAADLVKRDGRDIVVISVTNRGDAIVSLLPLRVVVEDRDGIPVQEMNVYAAFPLQIDQQPGPLMPGEEPRKICRDVWREPNAAKVRVELVDLRVAKPTAEPQGEAAPKTTSAGW